MDTIAACVVCDSVDLRTWPAVVAPFIADYAIRAGVPACQLMECRSCGFRFFDARLTDVEIGRLYAEYRGDGYFRCRHHHEFWYTRSVNDRVGRDPQETIGRTQACERFLRRFLEPEAIERVLDFGGDRGQFIPACVGREKYVFEISDAIPVAGVRRVSSESEFAGFGFELVMMCHVLEHCPDPMTLVRTLRRTLAEATWFYIEVPFERVNLSWAGRGTRHQEYLAWLAGRRVAWTLMDFFSTACRVRWNVLPPLGVIKCHEHLNFFDERSLRTLLERCGLQVVGCHVGEVRSRSGVTRILQSLAR
jgi:SAM-dependent methyltransferase